MHLPRILITVLLLLCSAPLVMGQSTAHFDDIEINGTNDPDGDGTAPLASYMVGSHTLTFDNASLAQAGVAFNDQDFPNRPQNGAFNNAIIASDPVSPLLINFDLPTTFAGGFFSFDADLTLRALSGGMEVGFFTTSGGNSGSAPSFFSFDLMTPFTTLEISSLNGAFVLDDFQFGAAVNPIPEPTTLLLLSISAVAVAIAKRRKRINENIPNEIPVDEA